MQSKPPPFLCLTNRRGIACAVEYTWSIENLKYNCFAVNCPVPSMAVRDCSAASDPNPKKYIVGPTTHV